MVSAIFFTPLSINTNMVYGYFRKSGSTWPSVVSAAVNGVFIYVRRSHYRNDWR